jgi:hypothetical protein
MPWVGNSTKGKSCIFNELSGMAILVPVVYVENRIQLFYNDDVTIYVTIPLGRALKMF